MGFLTFFLTLRFCILVIFLVLVLAIDCCLIWLMLNSFSTLLLSETGVGAHLGTYLVACVYGAIQVFLVCKKTSGMLKEGGARPLFQSLKPLVMGLFVPVHAPSNPSTPRSVFTKVIYLFKVTVIIPVSLSSIKGD